ncbi:transposase [uncultured Marinococcus sp.]|uniref:transposase n=1 Tax=uncultured Marinococcus sp. TaxID=487012 RepID=UPI00261F2829|nr:transposase [uncultured Marinococcus sp.]
MVIYFIKALLHLPAYGWMHTSKPNGAAEGTNHKIKLIRRRGHGYRNFAHFSLRIRLEIGNRRRKLVKSMFW